MKTRFFVSWSLALTLLACAHGGEGGQTTAASPEGTAPPSQATAPASEGTAPASEGTAQAQTTPEGQGPSQTIVGKVASVEGNSVTVKATELADPHELSLGEDTRITHEGESISRDQIQQGDLVRASYVGEERSGRATEIVVIQKGEGEAPASEGGGEAPASPSSTGR